MLLPVDMLEWLPDDHFVFALLEMVDALDLSGLEACYRLGTVGRQAHDPKMLVALLAYAYSLGVRSSRLIERKCREDVAFRIICGNQPPDHCAIARFRGRCGSRFVDLFGQVLDLCVSLGMVDVSVVSVDGTKIGGRASLRANHSADTLRRIAEQAVAEAARVDAEEDAEFGDRCGDELPDEWKAGPGRAARIRALVDQRRRAEQALEQTKLVSVKTFKKDVTPVESAQRRLDKARRRLASAARDAESRRVPDVLKTCGAGGRPRKLIEEHARVKDAARRVGLAEAELAAAQVESQAAQARRQPVKTRFANLSDPDSKPMPLRGGGFLQGYNAQIVVTDDHVILAADVTRSPSDNNLFVPMMGLAEAAVADHVPEAAIGVILADAGYCSQAAITADGPDRLIAVGRDPSRNKARRVNPVILRMGERLQAGTEGRRTYKRRSATVETVFGNLKETMGFRRFTRRGLQAARDEWMFVATVFNMRRLAVHQGIALA